MASFLERLRGPLLSMGSGGMGSNSMDPLDQLASISTSRAMSQRFGPGPMRRGGGGGNVPDWIRQTAINARGLPPGVENVVYDQRPEQFNKELALKKQAMANEQAENQAKLDFTKNAALRDETQKNRDRELSERDLALKREIFLNPALEFKEAGDEFVQFNPRTGQATKSGVKTGKLTEQDRLNQVHKSALDVANAREAGDKSAAEIAAEGRVRAAEISAAGKGGNESASDQNQRMRQFLNENPQFRDFVTFENGGFSINTPSSTVEATKNNPDMDTWRKLNRALNGQTGPDVQGVGSAALGRQGAMGSGSLGMPRTGGFRPEGEAAMRPGEPPPGTGAAPRGGIKMLTPDGRPMTVPDEATAKLYETKYKATRVR